MVIFTPCRTRLVQDDPQQPTETQDGETHRGIRHEEHHRQLQQRRISRGRDAQCKVGLNMAVVFLHLRSVV